MIKLMLKKAAVTIILLATLVEIKCTPLDDYVNAPDSYFSYELIKTYNMVGYKIYILNMTSQKWMDETFVKNPIWWHHVIISIPDKIIRTDVAFLFIEGGSTNS